MEKGLIFIGPPYETFKKLDDKILTKETASSTNAPIIPDFLTNE